MVYSVDRPSSIGSLSARRQLLMMMGPSTQPAPGAEPFTQAESPRMGKRSSMSRAGGTSRARRRPLPRTRALSNGSKHRRGGEVRLDWRPGGRASPARHSFGASTGLRARAANQRAFTGRTWKSRSAYRRSATPFSRCGNKNIQQACAASTAWCPAGQTQDSIGAYRGPSGSDNAPACLRPRARAAPLMANR